MGVMWGYFGVMCCHVSHVGLLGVRWNYFGDMCGHVVFMWDHVGQVGSYEVMWRSCGVVWGHVGVIWGPCADHVWSCGCHVGVMRVM